ncbi:CPBP family intramembrane glutamic endopeptidase [Caloranaerobacter azorensis]|uniref:CPBP family intramembrane metalloprotease n=1 Tax=Caloranaerobacter azorensis TaxID=116090 RepID=A0A6P1YC66_9FIRM|nr:type II CAAX endopeptidase family protein [Caloranaerobacter azorensis]QIB26960.1 CPBP family intramembrane metalloprotease [Caloranaerobacter azorensis]
MFKNVLEVAKNVIKNKDIFIYNIFVYMNILDACFVYIILSKIIRFKKYKIYNIKDNLKSMKGLIFSYISFLVVTFFLCKNRLTFNSITFFNVLIRKLALILPCMCISFFFEKEDFKSLGITSHNVKKSLLFGIIFGISYITIKIIFFTKVLDKQLAMPLLTYLKYNLQHKVLLFQLSGILTALVEEIIFRGYFQIRLINALGFKKGIITTNILFSIYHIPAFIYIRNYENFLISFPHLIFTFCIGLILSYQSYKSKNIISSFISHFFINLM